MMKQPYLILTRKDNTTIVNRLKFNKNDKLKDFLANNKDCKNRMEFV